MNFDDLYYYQVFTLVDITETKVYHTTNSQDKDIKRNQQRNWDTVVQILGLRCQVFDLTTPTAELSDIKNLFFGSDFSGIQKVWSFTFGVDRPDIFRSNNYNPTGALFLDFDNVPIITGLTETVNFKIPVFRCHSTQKNITFSSLKNGK
ncbi:MAG: hypothetical protein N2235_01535 [Fischerella sp.]|nr:hypothetical protein [Fischerella sp.]